MRIISQNKDLSIDFNHTPICVSYNHVCAIMDGQQKVIGKYETDERAKEVFEEIHIAYSGTNILFQNMDMDYRLKKSMLDACTNISVACNNDTGKVEYINNGVYRMPAE